MTHIKMPPQKVDYQKSTDWGIAFLSSVSGGLKKVGGALVIFDLINMDTKRAHRLTFAGVGKQTGTPATAAYKNTGYVYFQTSVPANFMDFDEKSAKLEMKDRLWKSKRKLTIFREGIKTLFAAKVNGSGPTSWSGINALGRTSVLFSDGRPVETPEVRIPVTDEELPPGFKIKENADSLVIIASDVALFDFDKDLIHYKASEALSNVMKFINSRPGYVRIVFEGHTDSKGDHIPGYNMNLSRRRAQAVLAYFKKYADSLDSTYRMEAKWFGATNPVEPNTLNGVDNEAGREKNRRVEIVLYKR